MVHCHYNKKGKQTCCVSELCKMLYDCKKNLEKKIKKLNINCFKRPKKHDLSDTSSTSTSSISTTNTTLKADPVLLDLPTELLEKVFGYVDPIDILRLERTCSTFRQICSKSRQRLPKIPIQFANCQYGKWFDVLKKHPCKRVISPVNIEYTLSEPIFNQKSSIKQKPSRGAPFDFIAKECNFEFLTVDVELLNADFRNLMHFDKLQVNSLILNFSHPKLPPRIMDRYLPCICDDLNLNKHIQSVDFIFCQKPENETYKEKLNRLMKNGKTIKVYLLDVYKVNEKMKNKFI